MTGYAKDYSYLIGEHFGRLTITSILNVIPGKPRRCLCECACGTKNFEIAINDINRTNRRTTRSCGCLAEERKLKIKPGDIFGRLTVIKSTSVLPGKYSYPRFLCKCECGNKTKVVSYTLHRGTTKSCGCLNLDNITTHNMSYTGTYSSYRSMLKRCYNKNHEAYKNYGKLGVKVCKRWKNSFENFLADMGERPKGKTVDRIDPFGNYNPKNCRWASRITQMNNMRYNVKINYKDKIMTLARACRKEFPKNKNILKIYKRALGRIRLGWDDADLFLPKQYKSQ